MSMLQCQARFPWMAVSVVVHLLLLGVLFLVVAPEPETMAELRQRQIEKLSSRTLEEAAEQLEQLNREKLERDVDRLEEIRRQMEQMRQQQLQKLATEKADRPAEALEQAAALIDRIIAAQRAVIVIQQTKPEALAEATEAAMASFQTTGDERLRSFHDGAGRRAWDALFALRRLTDEADRQINAIQQLQVELSAELAWLDDPRIADLQQRAIEVQERGEYDNHELLERFDWIGRDLEALWKLTANALEDHERQTSKQRAVDRAERKITGLEKHPPVLMELAPKAIESQRRAYEAQLAVKKALKQVPPPEPLDAEQFKADVAVEPKPAASAEPTLSQLYEQGVRTERTIAELAAEIRAATIARASDVALSSARADVEASPPDRPEADIATLDGEPSTGAAYEAFKEELANVVNTSTSMVSSAEAAMGATLATVAGAEAPPTEAVTATGGGSTGGATGDEPGDGRPAAKDPEAMRAETMAAVDAGRIIIEGNPDWMFIDGWYTIGPFTDGTSASLSGSYAPEQVVDLGAAYRGPDGRTLRWTFRREPRPGTSYFPVQAGNSVSYAFTHIKAPRDMTVRLALASDDASTVWVNGDQRIAGPTWHETAENNSWLFSFGEDMEGLKSALHYRGYRQARLDEGVNTILLRVENGPGRSSFAVYVKPAASPQ